MITATTFVLIQLLNVACMAGFIYTSYSLGHRAGLRDAEKVQKKLREESKNVPQT